MSRYPKGVKSVIQSSGISKGKKAESIPDSKVGISSSQPNKPSKRDVSPKMEMISINASSKSWQPKGFVPKDSFSEK